MFIMLTVNHHQSKFVTQTFEVTLKGAFKGTSGRGESSGEISRQISKGRSPPFTLQRAKQAIKWTFTGRRFRGCRDVRIHLRGVRESRLQAAWADNNNTTLRRPEANLPSLPGYSDSRTPILAFSRNSTHTML